ncbi:4486_t:CDS:1, partial [Dentiscutata heterogama]
MRLLFTALSTFIVVISIVNQAFSTLQVDVSALTSVAACGNAGGCICDKNDKTGGLK